MGWIKKVINWLKASNRWKHLLLAFLVGLGCNGWYCAEYTGLGVAGAMEFKDWQWGGKPDWIDFALTVIGVNAGYLVRYLIEFLC